jgi:hypothetical protein
MSCEHGEDDGDDHDWIIELRLLTAVPVCLETGELREALRLARRLGRVTGHGKRPGAGIVHYRRTLVQTARVAGMLSPATEEYWAGATALCDGRVVAFAAGCREARRETG